MKKAILAILAICSLMSAVSYADDQDSLDNQNQDQNDKVVVHEGSGRVVVKPGHPGRVVIHDGGHKVVVIDHHDYRYRFRPGFRWQVREGVIWGAYAAAYTWGVWGEYTYSWNGYGFIASNGAYLLANEEFAILAGEYPGLYQNPQWVQIVPFADPAYPEYNAALFVNGNYVMDLYVAL